MKHLCTNMHDGAGCVAGLSGIWGEPVSVRIHFLAMLRTQTWQTVAHLCSLCGRDHGFAFWNQGALIRIWQPQVWLCSCRSWQCGSSGGSVPEHVGSVLTHRWNPLQALHFFTPHTKSCFRFEPGSIGHHHFFPLTPNGSYNTEKYNRKSRNRRSWGGRWASREADGAGRGNPWTYQVNRAEIFLAWPLWCYY